jgi:hypothetical protein
MPEIFDLKTEKLARLCKAYRFGLNPQYNSETASVDPNYAVQQYAWVWILEK